MAWPSSVECLQGAVEHIRIQTPPSSLATTAASKAIFCVDGEVEVMVRRVVVPEQAGTVDVFELIAAVSRERGRRRTSTSRSPTSVVLGSLGEPGSSPA
jgi:hypothetical protein